MKSKLLNFKLIFFLIIFLGIFGSAKSSFAADFYITQNASGNNSGADCANAHPVTWFNTLANWSNPKVSGKIGPGDTVHLCDTINSTLTFQASGLSESVITLLFESGAKMSSTCWSYLTGAINTNQKNYIVIDGGTNGIIENTNNGTSLGTQNNSTGILATASSNLEVKNITIQNLYIRTGTTDVRSNCDSGGGIFAQGPGSSVSIHDNTIHDVCYPMNFQVVYTNTNDISVYSNNFYNHNIGFNLGVGTYTLSNTNIFGNTFHDYVAWDDLTNTNNYHHNGAHVYTEAGARVSGLNFYGNLFYGNQGQRTTSNLIYLEADQSGSGFDSCLVYDNVAKQSTNNYGNFGTIAIGGSGYVTNSLMANNTLIGNGTDYGLLISGSSNNLMIRNNIFKGYASAGFYYPNGNPAATWDYNFYSGNTYLGTDQNGNNYSALSTWKSHLGGSNETHGVSNPTSGVNADGTLNLGSPAIDAGVSLVTYFNTDYAGGTRFQGSAWDIGAYEFNGGGSGDTTPPAAPQGLSVQ